MASGQRTQARQAFEAAKAADPNFAPADLALAGLDHADKHLDDALRRLTTVLNIDPRNVSALLMLANQVTTCLTRGQF